ncbi:hypothetical protein TNCV_2471271 [Trichonephila clavipes]|nr:hypothetical protein TNCV_2471271 [Trichonephila clavipes]
MTALIRLGIESNRDWMSCRGTETHAASTRCHSSSTVVHCRMATNQSLGNHGPEVFCWFVIDYTIEDTPTGDITSMVASVMVSELRVHAAANVIELFMQTHLSCGRSQFLTQGS